MQRRQHAEELLEWKRRLDAEEAEIRQMEKQALAAWDKDLVPPKTPKKELEEHLRTEQKGHKYLFCSAHKWAWDTPFTVINFFSLWKIPVIKG